MARRWHAYGTHMARAWHVHGTGRLVRSAASFALSRSSAAAAADGGGVGNGGRESDAQVTRADLELALREVTPALRARDGALRAYFRPHGVGCTAHAALRRGRWN